MNCSVCGHSPAVLVQGTYWLCGPCVLERIEPPSACAPSIEDLLAKPFYELMQVYRWAGITPQYAEQAPAAAAFNAVKDYIRQHFVARDIKP